MGIGRAVHETGWSRLVGMCGVEVVNDDENYQCMDLDTWRPSVR